MLSNLKKGKRGEYLAKKFLIQKGYYIIIRNYRYDRYEIDIIASKNQCIHFIEVKYRTTRLYGNPETSIDDFKENNLIEAAEDFLYKRNVNQDISFDVIAIIEQKNNIEIEYIQDIFS